MIPREYDSNPEQRKCERCGLGMIRKFKNNPFIWICPNNHTEAILGEKKEFSTNPMLCLDCGFEMSDSKENLLKVFPPDKYNYCHCYCCKCCPDAKITPCDKERVDGNTYTGGVILLNKNTGEMTRWLPK